MVFGKFLTSSSLFRARRMQIAWPTAENGQKHKRKNEDNKEKHNYDNTKECWHKCASEPKKIL